MSALTRGDFARTVAGAGAAAALPSIAGAQTPAPVKGAITSIYYDAVPILWAQKTGMFAKAGIDIDLGRLPTGAAVTTAVATGNLNIGKSTFFAVVAAFQRGLPLVVLAPAVIYDSRFPNGALVVPKDSPIRTVADLNGKVISVNNLSEPTRPATELWLQKNGMAKDVVKFVEIPMSAMSAALDSNRADIAFLTVPVIDEVLATGRYRTLEPVLNYIAPRWWFSAIIASRDWAVANRDAAKRVASVVEASAAYTNAHHRELSAQIADLIGATPASVANMTWPQGGTAIVPAEMQPVIDLSVKAGFIPKGFDARDMLLDSIKA
ncbi:MAG TPA: ABC transporter substrate-binding protein [Candidatus Lustribacter sp.]|jgi:NitT/TauT family transport system substrate-binding protein|nr:ABC transporter substrate-binding protein [Candidatus Lustribacter sp.]